MTTEQEELKKTLESLFDANCHNNVGYGSYTFTTAERISFIGHLVEMAKGLHLLDSLVLARLLLKTEGKFPSAQDRAVAILNGP